MEVNEKNNNSPFDIEKLKKRLAELTDKDDIITKHNSNLDQLQIDTLKINELKKEWFKYNRHVNDK